MAQEKIISFVSEEIHCFVVDWQDHSSVIVGQIVLQIKKSFTPT